MTGLQPAVAIIVIATFFLAWVYRWLWRRAGNTDTATGFGVLFAPLLLFAACFGVGGLELSLALCIITVGSAIYWFDDVMGLGAWLRVGLAAVAGLAIALIIFVPQGHSIIFLAALAAMAAISTVTLVNMVNFQDGADLNLALFILLTMALIIAYAPPTSLWTWLSVVGTAFVATFAVVNSRPSTLYFGDSGSFAFGAFLALLGMAFIGGDFAPPPEAAIPAALPFVDMAWVTSVRIRIRQRFTVRHYFHLYQRLQRDHPGHFYLMPQFLNAALCVAIAEVLGAFGVGRFAAVAIAMIVITIPVFIFCHSALVHGEPGPPERRT